MKNDMDLKEVRTHIRQLLLTVHRLVPSSDGYYAQEWLVDAVEEEAGKMEFPEPLEVSQD